MLQNSSMLCRYVPYHHCVTCVFAEPIQLRLAKGTQYWYLHRIGCICKTSDEHNGWKCKYKKGIRIQLDCTVATAILTLLPGSIGRFMVHQNWSAIFSGGALERIYVLSILSQLPGVDKKRTFDNMYSPIVKVVTLFGIPLGIFTRIFFG